MKTMVTWLIAAPLIYPCILMVMLAYGLMYLIFDYKFKGTP